MLMIFHFLQDICKALWCYRGNKRCETKFLPAAEGTSCGSGMVRSSCFLSITFYIIDLLFIQFKRELLVYCILTDKVGGVSLHLPNKMELFVRPIGSCSLRKRTFL